MATSFLFLRHGESEANIKGILAGRNSGVNLTAKGRDQISDLAQDLLARKIDLAFTSPLERTMQSSALFLATRNIPLTVDPAFVEMDYGSWSGKKLAILAKKKEWKIIQSDPERFTFPGGESFAAANIRIQNRLNELILKNPRQDKTILIVTHGDIIKMAMAYALGLPLQKFQNFRVDTASISEIVFHQGSYALARFNYQAMSSNRDGKTTSTKPFGANSFTLGGEIK
jgi:broad specificity phosphatase PhoE